MKTGEHSINSRIHGQIRALMEQAKDKSFDFEDTKRLMKTLAVIDGYPTVTRHVKYRGVVRSITEPASLSGQSDSVALILCTAIMVFADERNLWLYEFKSADSEEIYRSLGGRTFAEMVAYIADLRVQGSKAEEAERPDEARALEQRARELEKKCKGHKTEEKEEKKNGELDIF